MTSLLHNAYWWVTCCSCLSAVVAASSVTSMDVSGRGTVRNAPLRPPANLTIPNNMEQAARFKEWQEKEEPRRRERMMQRKMRAKGFLQKLPQPQKEQLEFVSAEHFESMTDQQKERGLSWFGGGTLDTDAYSARVVADPSEEYDKWAQAYRMLGGFIDCDHDQGGGGGSHNSGDNGDAGGACSRWMMWAAYVNPNYQGNGYDEYFGDEPVGLLDCHSPESEWQLLGVYRQEFYQFIEQISKHLWAIDDYEYVVALAGLAYMTDADCFQVGNDNDGNAIYAGVAPQPYGKFQMALYTDEYCLVPDESLGMTFDDYGLTSDIDLGSKDDTDDDGYSWAYDDWYATQEYTLTNLNDVYEEFKYCTSCVDYPTYQDGYFIGDDGTDDDDLINQCWKFYSHDSFTCEAECISMAHAQGTILSLKYGDATFGKTTSNFYQNSKEGSAKGSEDSAMTRLLANAFLTFAFLLFIATFLAFAVARRSRYRESRSSRSRRLLDDEDGKGSRSKSRRSSRGKSSDPDGLFKSSRSKSSGRKSRSSSKGKRSKSQSKRKSYEPPQQKQDEYF